MFRKKTVFVIGAGASAELDFPVGSALRDRIVKLVNVKFSPMAQQEAGDTLLFQQLRASLGGDGQACVKAGERIARGIYGARSIDEYLDWNPSDTVSIRYGKSAIVKVILAEEERAQRAWFGHGSAFSLKSFQNKWYGELFQLLRQGLKKDGVSCILDNVKFVIFNYDRCLENFLYHAIQAMDVEEGIARELCSSADVFYHPYGVVAPLFGPSGIRFGDSAVRNHVDLSSNIRTFTEERTNDQSLSAIREAIVEAESLVFLGFSFNEQNLALLSPDAQAGNKLLFGTSYSLPAPQTEDIRG